jgi:hypothetical protein
VRREVACEGPARRPVPAVDDHDARGHKPVEARIGIDAGVERLQKSHGLGQLSGALQLGAHALGITRGVWTAARDITHHRDRPGSGVSHHVEIPAHLGPADGDDDRGALNNCLSRPGVRRHQSKLPGLELLNSPVDCDRIGPGA